MVRTKGPLTSHSAFGQLAKVMIFSENKGRSYAKRHRSPKQPDSAAQVANRQVASLISRTWRNFSQANRDSWLSLAADANIHAFDACLSYNLRNWGDYLYPTQLIPTNRTNNWGTLHHVTVAQQGRGALWSVQYTLPVNNWGMAIHYTGGASGPATKANLIRIIPCGDTNEHLWLWTPLDPGTYYFRAVQLADDGHAATPGGIRSVTIT